MSKKYWNVLIIIILTISITTASSLVYSQDKEDSTQEKYSSVTLGDEVIFDIKNPAGGFSAQERAQKISDKLKAIADIHSINLDDLYIEPQNQNSIIVLRNSLVTLTEEDAHSEKKSIKQLGEDYQKKIKNAVNKYREKNRAKKWFAPWLTLFIFVFFLILIVLPFFSSMIKIMISNGREWFGSSWAWITLPIKAIKEKFKIPPENFEDKYRVGELDNTGKLIEYIYRVTNDYIIYRTNKMVRWLFDSKLDIVKRQEYEDRINKIMNYLAIIEVKNPKAIERVETINRLTAKGIELALASNHDSATKILKQAEERIESFRKIDTKLQYLISSFYTVITILLAIIICVSFPAPAFFSPSLINIIQEFKISEMFLIAIACGALGGFLSVASGINRISIDPDSDVIIAGMSRIFIAIISSVIIYIALRAGLLSDLSKLVLNNTPTGTEPNGWRVGFISAAAGFTESLVPNILDLSNRGTSDQQLGKEVYQSKGSNGSIEKEKRQENIK